MIIGSAYLAEIIDPKSGEPVERGKLGELVLNDIEAWLPHR